MSSFGGGRTATVRMVKIFEAVQAGDFPNCKTLADRLEVTRKTVQRDITYMRDQMGIALCYNQSQHGYELIGDMEKFPLVDLQVEDLAALFLAKQALGAVQGTKLAEALRPAFEKLSKQLEGKVSMNWRSLDEAFAVKENGVVHADLTLFGKLAEAVLQQKEVSFQYRKMGASASGRRRIQPYHVGEIGGGWYVIGHDLERDGLRTFALQRIVGLNVLKSTFQRPLDFKIGEHLGGSIGVWSNQTMGSKTFDVELEVTGWVARVVQERLWHPSQKTRLLDELGERVEVRMQLGNTSEITQLVLSWGKHVKVVAPRALVDVVREELAQAAAQY